MKFSFRKIFSPSNLLYALFLLLFTFFALEIILRIFHPFYFTIKGNKLVLPVNMVYHTYNTNCPKLDAEVTCTKNAIGFRGAEKPKDFNKELTILTIGGSTTACSLLSDEYTWSYLLDKRLKENFNNEWLNNAGIDGASTFGHQMLLDDFVVTLKPKVIIFLVGANDVSREDIGKEQGNLIAQNANWRTWIMRNSEVVNLFVNYMRSRAAQKLNLGNKYMEFATRDTFSLSDSVINKEILKQQALIPGYKSRLEKIIKTCRDNNIEPILVTQPSLAGFGIDSATHINLATVSTAYNGVAEAGPGWNGKEYWAVLQLFNKQTIETGKENNCFVIDMASKFPKNSTYYYDFIHYVNPGARKFAGVLSDELIPYLSHKYPTFTKTDRVLPAQ